MVWLRPCLRKKARQSRVKSAVPALQAGPSGLVKAAAMERRPARTPLAKECLPKGSIQHEALTGAPSPSAWPKGEIRSRRTPRHKEQGR